MINLKFTLTAELFNRLLHNSRHIAKIAHVLCNHKDISSAFGLTLGFYLIKPVFPSSHLKIIFS